MVVVAVVPCRDGRDGRGGRGGRGATSQKFNGVFFFAVTNTIQETVFIKFNTEYSKIHNSHLSTVYGLFPLYSDIQATYSAVIGTYFLYISCSILVIGIA